jgi:UV DNA damage endonuclease
MGAFFCLDIFRKSDIVIKMKYGLVCISELLRDKNPELAFKTMTRTQFLKKNRDESIGELSRRISHNLTVTIETLKHCKEVGIKHYRLSCKLFPLVTDPTLKIQVELLPYWNILEQKLMEIGRVSRELNITMSIHPDQFVVLGSNSDDICAKSIAELNFHAWVLDQMKMPQTHQCPINIHPSLSNFESAEKFVDKFILNFFRCDMGVRNRLVLENEDKGFWTCSNLYDYFHNYMKQAYSFYFPLTYDNLHDTANPSILPDGSVVSFKNNFMRFFQTWDFPPVFHWSEAEVGTKRNHAKNLTTAPPDMGLDVTWEIEVKGKDKAFIHLIKRLHN